MALLFSSLSSPHPEMLNIYVASRRNSGCFQVSGFLISSYYPILSPQFFPCCSNLNLRFNGISFSISSLLTSHWLITSEAIFQIFFVLFKILSFQSYKSMLSGDMKANSLIYLMWSTSREV
ncbi:hypothetical protein LXL04_002757 [Taraxacum kok-saghyz]